MIRNICNWFALLLIFVALSDGALAAPRAVTLEDAQQLAVHQNFGLKALKMEMESQEAQVGITRALFFPKFGVVGGFENLEGGTKRDSATLSYIFGTWNLFNGFADQMAQRRTSIMVQIAQSMYRKSEIELRMEVAQLFYRYLHQKAILSFYDKAKDLNEKHLGSARKRRASGLLSEADLMDFELRDSLLQSEMRLIQQRMTEIKLGLVRLMGPELGAAFEPVGSLPHLHLLGDMKEYLTQASATIESLKQSNLQIEGAMYDLKKSRSAWLPSVDVGVRMGALPLDQRLDNSNRGMASLVTARWELFSGFETTSQIRAAEAELKRREFEGKQQLLTVMAVVEAAVSKLKSIEERVDLEKQNEDRAQKLYNVTFSEYSRGIKNSTDVKAAELLLLEVRLRRVGFKNDFLETRSELERMYGIKFRVQEHSDSH